MTDHHVISVVVSDNAGWIELPDRTVTLTPGTSSAMQKEAVQVLLAHVREVARPIAVAVHEGQTLQHLRVGTEGTVTVTGSTIVEQDAKSLTHPGRGQQSQPQLTTQPHVRPPASTPAKATAGPVEPDDFAHANEEPRRPAPAPNDVPNPYLAVTPAGVRSGPDVSRRRADLAPDSIEPEPEPEPVRPAEHAPRVTPRAVPELIEQVHHRPVADVAARMVPAPGLSVIDHGRRSFIDHGRPEAPARHGLRGMLTRVGIRVEPSDAERAEREDRRAVAQHWPSRRTIAIVNGKGGAGKTPTTVCLSAIFARHGGGGVAAWDNNQTRGTLGWRTEKGPHDATLLELRDRAKDLRSTQAEAAEIAQFVHHQPDDKYDVLRSQPMILRDEQRLGVRDFDSIAKVLGKYYRLIFIDSGNDESDPLWGRMIDHADQIVVATTTRSDIAEAGALLLEGLTQRDEHAAALARNAVVVVSQAKEHAPAREAQELANELGHVVRETVTIPFDRGMVEGLLQLDNLRPETRRAWLAAGAAVARGL